MHAGRDTRLTFFVIYSQRQLSFCRLHLCILQLC